MRQRAALLAHVQPTNRQDTRPEIGMQSASNADRAGVAARLDAPAVHKTMAVARALITSDAPMRRALALVSLQPAQHHEAQPLSL
jgi:hypothetical protein